MPIRPARDLVQVEQIGHVAVVQFNVEAILDEEMIRAITEKLFSLVKHSPNPKILLNFTRVTHLSSAMLGTLIRLHKKVTTAGGRLALCNIHPDIFEVFKITQLNKILNVYPDEVQALEKF